MGKVTVIENVTLDGVMQAPGFAELRLTDATTTTTGVVIATYEQEKHLNG